MEVAMVGSRGAHCNCDQSRLCYKRTCRVRTKLVPPQGKADVRRLCHKQKRHRDFRDHILLAVKNDWRHNQPHTMPSRKFRSLPRLSTIERSGNTLNDVLIFHTYPLMYVNHIACGIYIAHYVFLKAYFVIDFRNRWIACRR